MVSSSNTVEPVKIIPQTENRDNKIKIPQLKFIKDKSEWLIKTEIQDKFYRFVYDKRVINDDFTTSPFGL